MKKIIYILLNFLLIAQGFSNAQEDKAIDAINNSPYIFDGTTCALDFIKDTSGKDFVSYKIIVNKVLKGNKQISRGDTIELISQMPTGWKLVDDPILGEILLSQTETIPLHYPYFKGIKLGQKTRGVYFVKADIFEGKKVFSLYRNTNDGYFAIRKIYKSDSLNNMIVVKKVYGLGKSFKNVDSFNSFLNKNGLEKIKEDVEDYKKKDVSLDESSINKDIATSKGNPNISHKGKLNYDSYMAIIKDRKINTKDTGHNRASEAINFEIKNEAVSCDSLGTKKFYEFDIYAYGSSSNTYLDNVAFVIKYNTNAFNTFIVNNQKIEITRGADFNNSTYADPMSELSDDTNNSIRFRLGTDQTATSWNRTLLTTTPNKLVHLKIEISNCENYTSDIKFLDLVNVSIVDVYTEDPSISPLLAPYNGYDANYIQPSPFHLCAPLEISDFYPKTITAGTNSILTIVGEGFGCYRGNTQVSFKSSEDGGQTSIPYLNDYDFIDSLWSDTLIKIRVPYSVQDSTTNEKYPLGSGYFKIIKESDIEASPLPLTIKYAIYNYNIVSSSNPANVLLKIPYRHVSITNPEYNYSNGHAREFYLDTSISNNPKMEVIVRKALRDWSCETGINWKIIDTIHKQGYIEDGYSVLFLDNTLADSILGLTFNLGLTANCIDASHPEKRFIYVTETDIGFARTPMIGYSWFLDTNENHSVPDNQFDFYHTVLHELGHAHYLGHVNDNTDLMFWSSTNGPISANNRLHIFTSPNSIEGGNYVIDNSILSNLSNCDNVQSTSIYTPENCSAMSVEKLNIDPYDISVFPNPFNNSITLKFNSVFNNKFNCSVRDISGKILYEYSFGNITEGNNIKTFDLSRLSSGIYLLTLKGENNIMKTVKIIKQ